MTVGLGFYVTLTLAGLAALMTQHHWLALAVRVAGGRCLIYLGMRPTLTKPEPVVIEPDEDDRAHRRSAGRPFLFDLSVTLVNPMAIVLFASVFAPAVNDRTPSWLMMLMVGLVMLASAA